MTIIPGARKRVLPSPGNILLFPQRPWGLSRGDRKAFLDGFGKGFLLLVSLQGTAESTEDLIEAFSSYQAGLLELAASNPSIRSLKHTAEGFTEAMYVSGLFS